MSTFPVEIGDQVKIRSYENLEKPRRGLAEVVALFEADHIMTRAEALIFYGAVEGARLANKPCRVRKLGVVRLDSSTVAIIPEPAWYLLDLLPKVQRIGVPHGR